jgi:hypothetical protein
MLPAPSALFALQELDQEALSRKNPGDAAPFEGHSRERRTNNQAADTFAVFQLQVQGFHFIAEVMKTPSTGKKIGDRRFFAGWFHQFDARRRLTLASKKRHASALQRVQKNLAIPGTSDRFGETIDTVLNGMNYKSDMVERNNLCVDR